MYINPAKGIFEISFIYFASLILSVPKVKAPVYNISKCRYSTGIRHEVIQQEFVTR